MFECFFRGGDDRIRFEGKGILGFELEWCEKIYWFYVEWGFRLWSEVVEMGVRGEY